MKQKDFRIRAIIFDQDETLIHPKSGLYEEYILERAKDYAQAFHIHDIEDAKRKAFEMKKKECNDSSIVLYDKMRISRDIWYDKINKIEVKKYLQKDIQLINFLQDLKKKKIHLFLLTNSPTLQTKRILEVVGLQHNLFDQIFTWIKGEEPPKPSSKPFYEIFKNFKVKPEECLMVGNEILVDLKTAHDLGIYTIGINPEAGPQKYMDFIIKELPEIHTIIKIVEKGEL